MAVDPVGVRSVIATVRPGRAEEAGDRRRHAAPAPEALPRDDEADPGRPDRRDRRRPSATGTRATCG
ncbi:MAG: hypothetical protein MZV64_42900 [Ignavibacteriales bacterium]|nr:hypothetical protein [Ignavibacteriales bacterium]